MKLFDEKGKIFGKVNFIDLTFIILVMMSVVLFLFVHLVREEPLKKVNMISVVAENVQIQIVDDILENDELYNVKYEKKKPIATIKEIVRVDPMTIINTNNEGQLVKSQHPYSKKIILAIEFSQPIYIYPLKQYYGTSRKKINIKIGADFLLENYKYSISGHVLKQGKQMSSVNVDLKSEEGAVIIPHENK